MSCRARKVFAEAQSQERKVRIRKFSKKKEIFLGETGDRGRKGRPGRKGVRSSKLFVNLKIQI